jgi:hypothetical protein
MTIGANCPVLNHHHHHHHHHHRHQNWCWVGRKHIAPCSLELNKIGLNCTRVYSIVVVTVVIFIIFTRHRCRGDRRVEPAQCSQGTVERSLSGPLCSRGDLQLIARESDVALQLALQQGKFALLLDRLAGRNLGCCGCISGLRHLVVCCNCTSSTSALSTGRCPPRKFVADPSKNMHFFVVGACLYSVCSCWCCR